MSSIPTLKELAGKLLAAKNVILTTHAGPDGDGLGSLAALALALEAHGTRVLRVLEEPLPQRYRFLDPDRRMRSLVEGRVDGAEGPWDLILVLDTHRWDMLGAAAQWLQSLHVPAYFLDHHPMSDEVRPEVYSESEAAATGELVYRLLHNHLGWSIDRTMAEPLYASISFDTCSFKYIRSNPACLLIAADLITRGVDTNRIYRDLFGSNSRGKARLLGHALSTVEFDCNGKLAHVNVPHGLVAELDLERDELRDSITHILEIQGVEIAATLKEFEPGLVNISLRSKGAYPINGVAVTLGGGGHALAAGCDFAGTIEQAWEALRGPLTRLCETA